MPENSVVYQNRELSWIKFNRRVLEEAEDISLPLAERLNFAAIWSNNLDEFVRVRVGSLLSRRVRNDDTSDNKTLMRPSEQLSAVYRELHAAQPLKDKLIADIELALAEKGVRRLDHDRLSPALRKRADDLFDHSVKPFANTYILTDGDSFPFLETGRIYVVLRLTNGSETFTALVSDNGEHERLLFSDGDEFEYILAEDILLARADSFFDGYTVTEKHLIRLSRSAAVTLDDEPNITSDRLEAMELILAKRKVMPPVRLQIQGNCPDPLLDMLTQTLEVDRNAVFCEHTPLDMKYVFALRELISRRTDLFYTPYKPVVPADIKENIPMAQQIAQHDILLSFPYESISPFLRLLNETAEDSEVTSVKMTLYRVAEDS